MTDWQTGRLTDSELHALFLGLFPHGFAGPDVHAEVAPEGWEHSPLMACFHPSVERVFEERRQMHRNLEELRKVMRPRDGGVGEETTPSPKPTLEETRREYEARPVRRDEELTELVGLCLWDIFADNHDVIVADGRLADIGSFRGASAFLDELLTGDGRAAGRAGDYMRFYMGTIWIAGRADLTPVYVLIFRRLAALGADWIHHFPELGLVSLVEEPNAETERLRADLAADNARAREEAMDRPPPATVRAYREVYGRDPRGWPPA